MKTNVHNLTRYYIRIKEEYEKLVAEYGARNGIGFYIISRDWVNSSMLFAVTCSREDMVVLKLSIPLMGSSTLGITPVDPH